MKTNPFNSEQKTLITIVITAILTTIIVGQAAYIMILQDRLQMSNHNTNQINNPGPPLDNGGEFEIPKMEDIVSE